MDDGFQEGSGEGEGGRGVKVNGGVGRGGVYYFFWLRPLSVDHVVFSR